jgi:hypothetical protein
MTYIFMETGQHKRNEERTNLLFVLLPDVFVTVPVFFVVCVSCFPIGPFLSAGQPTSVSVSSGVAPLKKDGKTYADASEKADLLNERFTSVFTKENTSTIPNLSTSKNGPLSFLLFVFLAFL